MQSSIPVVPLFHILPTHTLRLPTFENLWSWSFASSQTRMNQEQNDKKKKKKKIRPNLSGHEELMIRIRIDVGEREKEGRFTSHTSWCTTNITKFVFSEVRLSLQHFNVQPLIHRVVHQTPACPRLSAWRSRNTFFITGSDSPNMG